MNVLDTINNKIGSWPSAPRTPDPNTTEAVLTARMTTDEAHNPTNTLQMDVEADFGAGFRWMGSSPVWTGGPGKSPPTLAWQFNPAHPPLRVRGWLHNITQVIDGLDLTFA